MGIILLEEVDTKMKKMRIEFVKKRKNGSNNHKSLYLQLEDDQHNLARRKNKRWNLRLLDKGKNHGGGRLENS